MTLTTECLGNCERKLDSMEPWKQDRVETQLYRRQQQKMFLKQHSAKIFHKGATTSCLLCEGGLCSYWPPPVGERMQRHHGNIFTSECVAFSSMGRRLGLADASARPFYICTTGMEDSDEFLLP